MHSDGLSSMNAGNVIKRLPFNKPSKKKNEEKKFDRLSKSKYHTDAESNDEEELGVQEL